MATTATLHPDVQRFPPGTTVKAYKRSNFLPASGPVTGAPQGTQDASATVAADGSVSFTGLTDATDYMLYASVSGQDRYARFATKDTPSTSSSLSGGTYTGTQDFSGATVTLPSGIVIPATAASQALVPTAVKTGAYSVQPGDLVPVDISGGSVALTLPNAPADGTRVAVKVVAVSGTNTCSVNRGGTDVFNKAGGSTSLSLSLVNQAVQLQYKASTGIWYVVADDQPLSGLDSRYVAPTLVDAKGDLLVGTADNVVARKAVGTNGQVLVADSTQASGVNWSALAYVRTRMKSQYWYSDPVGATATAAPANGELTVIPFPVSRAVTLDRIAAEVTAAGEAGSLIRLGIYADDGDGYPGALLVDAGTIVGDGATGSKELTINQALEPGLYWLAALVYAATTTRPTMRRNQSQVPYVGATTSAGASNQNMSGYNVSNITTGVLPNPFTTGRTAAAACTRVMVRAA